MTTVPLSALAGAARLSALAGAARALLTPRGLAAAAVETLWGSAHLAIYPWGLVREQHEPRERYHLGGLAPAQRGLVIGDVEAAGTPILLVHGMVDNRMIFTVLRRGLHRRGFGRVFALSYSPTTNDIRGAARDLSALAGAARALLTPRSRTSSRRPDSSGCTSSGTVSAGSSPGTSCNASAGISGYTPSSRSARRTPVR
ncbi:MAG: hypothetical protein P8Z68_07580 [Kineosporiaceae bacterium]